MTPKQMQENSTKKAQQVMDLMKTLHIRIEAKEKLDPKTGFIEKLIFWIDDEKYPTPTPVPAAETPVAPVADVPVVDTSANEKTPA